MLGLGIVLIPGLFLVPELATAGTEYFEVSVEVVFSTTPFPRIESEDRSA